MTTLQEQLQSRVEQYDHCAEENVPKKMCRKKCDWCNSWQNSPMKLHPVTFVGFSNLFSGVLR